MMLTMVVAVSMAGVVGPVRQPSSGQEPKISNAAIICCNQSIRVPETPEHRLGGSVAVHLLAAQAGAAIVRVHDVAETVQALALAAAIGAAR